MNLRPESNIPRQKIHAIPEIATKAWFQRRRHFAVTAKILAWRPLSTQQWEKKESLSRGSCQYGSYVFLKLIYKFLPS
jgi:hypothetical protein